MRTITLVSTDELERITLTNEQVQLCQTLVNMLEMTSTESSTEDLRLTMPMSAFQLRATQEALEWYTTMGHLYIRMNEDNMTQGKLSQSKLKQDYPAITDEKYTDLAFLKKLFTAVKYPLDYLDASLVRGASAMHLVRTLEDHRTSLELNTSLTLDNVRDKLTDWISKQVDPDQQYE